MAAAAVVAVVVVVVVVVVVYAAVVVLIAVQCSVCEGLSCLVGTVVSVLVIEEMCNSLLVLVNQ